jgi:hypothetical protein
MRHNDSCNLCLSPDKRRRNLLRTAGLLPLFFGSIIVNAKFSSVFAAPSQGNWARCINCSMLFFNGYQKKGVCPAVSGGHQPFKVDADIRKYELVYDDSTGPGQGDWRYCRKCAVLFFNGYPSKGICAADHQGHDPAGYNFFLYHDREPTPSEESGWSFCRKCQALFYISNPAVCPSPQDGKGHIAKGYRFVVGQKANTL